MNNYCKECDYNLETSFKKYKNINNNNNIEKNNFAACNFNSLPIYYCNFCNKNNHKIDKCPLLNDNVDSLSKKKINKSCLSKSKIIKKSNLKSHRLNNDIDICVQLSNLNIKLSNKKKVNFILPTTH